MQQEHAAAVQPHYQQPQVAQPMYAQQPQVAQPMYAQQPQAAMVQQMTPVGSLVQPVQPVPAQLQRAPGIRPSAWQFVFSGVCHFLTHPNLWPYALIPVLVGGVIAVVALIIIFGTAFVPQQELLTDTVGLGDGLAWVIAFLLCVVEVAVITIVVLQASLGFIMESVFVKTMEQLNAWQGDKSSCDCADECCWVAIQLVLAIATLPLNFIPVLGTLAFCALNGAMLAWEYHELYFDMCGMSKRQQREEVLTHWQDYAAFGLASQLMLLVPVVGPFTFVTTVCGAACWAAELEKRGCRPARPVSEP